jgi:hypothetical protein
VSVPPGLRIERMSLQMPGTGRDEARRIALLVADSLERAAPGLAGAEPPHAARVAVQGRPAEPPEALADRIAAQIVAAMARSG